MFFIKKSIQNISKWAIFSLFFCVLLITAVLGLSNHVLADVNDPMAPPPEKNIPAFLNISGEHQTKRGALRLGTDDVASPFNYQLEVVGEGAKISNVIADKNLKVSNITDTLFIDAANNKVCLGPCLDIAGSKLEVSGGGMTIEGSANTGLWAVSSDSEAIYGIGTTYGVQGLASGPDNYGIWAVSTLGTAVEGINQSSNYSSVYGQSDTGYGIYGTNTNLASLWAGYFEGRLESNSDVSGAKFLPTQLQNSLVPFTSGQVAESYSLGNISVKYFDGTHLWAVDSTKLYKIRASDGFKIFEVSVVANPTDVLFDGNYIWVTVGGAGAVKKIDPYSGIDECSLAVINPQSIAFDGQYYWVTAENASGQGILVKIDGSDCSQVGGDISLTPDTFSLGKIIYNGSYLWALATDNGTGAGSVININPSTNDAMRWDGLIGSSPADIFFDNYYYWVTNTASDSVTRYYLSESKVCSQLDSGNPVACQTDAECSDGGFGSCLFAVPRSFGTYDTGEEPSYIAFDGTYIWVANVAGQSLTRLLAADPSQATSFSLVFSPTGLLFDGTYLWLSSSSELTKIYSGSGYGSTDLRDILTLQFNSPLIQQDGSISIDGSGRIGGDVTAGGDLTADNNVWGAEENGDIIQNTTYNNTWTNTYDLAGADRVYSLMETSDGTLYAGTGTINGDVFKSTDQGDSWTETGNLTYGGTDATYVYSLMETSDGTLYAGTGYSSDNVFKSTDQGDSWTKTGVLAGAFYVFSLMETSDGTLYAGTGSNGDVFKSTDQGDSWTNTGNLTYGGTDAVKMLSLIETSDGTLYAGTDGTNGNVFKSTDQGDSWTKTGVLAGATYVDSLIETSDGALYAGTRQGCDVFKSTDQGDSWTKTGELAGCSGGVNSLIETSDGALYAGGTGVFKSADQGDSWTETGELAGAFYVFSLMETSDGALYAGTGSNGDVFKLEFAPLPEGTYNCPAGHFVKNVEVDAEGKVTRIECRAL